jgi:DNA-binding beta-propeller fold protein YncE
MPQIKFILLPLLLCILLFYACDDMTDINELPNEETHPTESGTAELYILCEGLFNLNNSSLARYTFGNNTVTPDYFRRINHRGLGDTANDMAIYGSKLYIIVNVSSQLEIVDLQTGRSLHRLSLTTESGSSRQPRHITFDGGKAYICSFDGTVARIDTASYRMEAQIKVGRNPDGICVQNHKLYVSNSGGLDSPNYDNTVSVIDIPSFTEIKRIPVGDNPGKIGADAYGDVYVAVRGNPAGNNQSFIRIDSRTDDVADRYTDKVMSFAIDNDIAYLYYYDYNTQSSSIKVFDIQTETTLREHFITDGTRITTPYGIHVNPYNGNVYITDAYNYTVTGDVLCFNPQGELQFLLNGVGINPNTVVFSNKASLPDSNTGEPAETSSAFAGKVWAYTPAPGQFINTLTSAYKEGFTAAQVLAYADEQIKQRSLLTLGGFGGSLTLGFDHTVTNIPNAYDFKIYGNAHEGSSEPGIVLVSQDANHNGLPDDEWYELAGSEYHSAKVIRGYEITYYRPVPPLADVQWTDNQGGEGAIPRNSFHTENSYYPLWMDEQITFRGTLLPNNATNERNAEAEQWVQSPFAWGYADNSPNNSEYSQFNIDWAVDKEGNPAMLTGIDFVKIYSAINQVCGWTGETSTEVSAVEDLHYQLYY